MANTTDPAQTGTVTDKKSTTTETSTAAENPAVPEGVNEDQYKAAREQFEKDQEQWRENPNKPVVREAIPELGGEHFS